ncbi:HDIG domain-containing protein [Armatimonadota bacterium]|nr:HDIG domain-containing protein [Armatimonadota bacterium]
MQSREEAWKLLTEWTQSESLRKHGLSVEASMRYHALINGEPEELWGLTGLLHDFDYERHPDASEHPTVGMNYLRTLGYPEEMIQAIGGHATYLNIPRETALAKTLFAVDELSGFIIAVALTRPSRTLAEVDVSAVKKKLKQNGFARGVNREDIALGCEELGVEMDTLVENCIRALQSIASELGL